MKSILLFLAIISPVAASAQTALDFNREAYIMASGSYSLAVDSLSLAVDMEDLKSSNNLQDPEIEIGYLWGEKPTGNKWNVSVSQGFDWPGAYSARAKGIKAAQEVIGLTRRAGLLSRMLEVKQAMIDVVYSAKNMMLTRQMTDTIASMCAISRKAMEGGEITRLDMNMIEIVRIGMEEELRTAVADFDDKVAALTVLNNGRDCSALVERLTDYPDEMILPLESYQRQITENDPMIQAGRKQMKTDENMVRASQMMSYPGVSVGYTYENEGDERWHGVTFGLTLPIFSNRHVTSKSRLTAMQNRLKAETALNEATVMIENDRRKALDLYRNYTKYDKVINGDDNIALLRKAYRAGQMTCIEYLTEVKFFLDARRTFLQTEYLYHLALARLNRYSMTF